MEIQLFRRFQHLAILACSAVMFSACGGGSVASLDPRMAAVQSNFDKYPPSMTLSHGWVCQNYGRYDYENPNKYKSILGAHVGPLMNYKDSFGYVRKCQNVTWDSNVALIKRTGRTVIGQNVLDKLGEDENMMGVTYAKFRSHLELSALGQALVAKNVLSVKQKTSEGSVGLSKDVDGKLVASLGSDDLFGLRMTYSK